MKFRTSLTLLLVIFVCITAALSAKARGVIFAFDKTHAPFSFMVDGKPTGFDLDLLIPMFEGTKYGFAPTEFKWNDALVSLKKGVKVDMMSQMDKTPEREVLYDFTDEPYLIDEVRIFTKDDSICALNGLYGKKVAVQKGSYYEEQLSQNENITILATESEYDALEALNNDLVDAFVGPFSVAMYIIKTNSYDGIISVEEPLETSYMYFAVDHGDDELREFLNEGMKTLRENGTYETIYNKWFGQTQQEEESGSENPCGHPCNK